MYLFHELFTKPNTAKYVDESENSENVYTISEHN